MSGDQQQRSRFRFAVDQASAQKLVDPDRAGLLKPEFETADMEVELHYELGGNQTRLVKQQINLPLDRRLVECITMIATGEFDDTFKYSYD